MNSSDQQAVQSYLDELLGAPAPRQQPRFAEPEATTALQEQLFALERFRSNPRSIRYTPNTPLLRLRLRRRNLHRTHPRCCSGATTAGPYGHRGLLMCCCSGWRV
jgi:hypothetical protein